MQNSKPLRDFHAQHVFGVQPGGYVTPEMHMVAQVTNEVSTAIRSRTTRIHIRSIALKHIYEKRNAYEYDVLIDNLDVLVKFPDQIYKNDNAKKADYIFAKQIYGALYACLIKQNAHPETGQDICIVVTALKTTVSYLAKFQLIQSWKGGTPSS